MTDPSPGGNCTDELPYAGNIFFCMEATPSMSRGMRHARPVVAAVFGFAFCGSLAASTVTLVVPTHMVVTHVSPANISILRTMWSSERLIAQLQVDVCQLPQMRSTTEHYAALRQLASARRWLDEVKWKLGRRDTGAIIAPNWSDTLVIRRDSTHCLT